MRAIFALCLIAATSSVQAITFEERVAAQTAIEQVYWNHRIWPADNPGPKPALSAVVPDEAIRGKVETYLRQSEALERFWQRPITASQLQAELDRIVKGTRDPGMLRELFAALGDDASLIAETLVRQTLAERLLRDWYAAEDRSKERRSRRPEVAIHESASGASGPATLAPRAIRSTAASIVWSKQPFDTWWSQVAPTLTTVVDASVGSYAIAPVPAGGCATDRWEETAHDFEPRTGHTAVWTGTEMIVWGGRRNAGAPDAALDSGARYNPATDSWLTIARGPNAPSARHAHTAVWTGTEMIVWGGTDGLSVTNYQDGGRYDPSTDAWLPVSTIAWPAPRRYHTAVWTGTEMIVWGGQSNASSSGSRYSPSSDSWTTMSTFAAPSPRYRHTAVWTGDRMIVWGGSGLDGITLDSGGMYDPATNGWTWTSVAANVPSARFGHSAIWSGAEMIVWGGGDATPTSTGGRFNPQTNSWLPTSAAGKVPEARSFHAAVWTGNEMVVWGGSGVTRSGARSDLSSGGRYSPATDAWIVTPPGRAPSARAEATAVWTGAEMIVWGGNTPAGNLSSGGRYAPASNSWVATRLPNAGQPVARYGHSAVWTGTEMIVWGGADAEPVVLGDGARYAPATNSWVPISNNALARRGHSAVWTGTEMIVWGGDSTIDWGDASPTPLPPEFVNTGSRYNPATDTWKATAKNGPNVPSARGLHTAVWTGTEMIVWGGVDGNYTSTGGRYDPASNTWAPTPAAGAASARANHTAVWTGTEMIVWGGSPFAPATAVGRYRPSTNSWTPASPSGDVPEARTYHRAVWTGSEMIVWGGNNPIGLPIDTGGRYDPAADAWLPTSTLGAPVPRAGHTMVWTGAEAIVWGGGGANFGDLLDDGGRYDPGTDTWLPTSSGAPSPRTAHTAVWTGSEMIVWGGTDGGNIQGPFVLDTGGRYCGN